MQLTITGGWVDVIMVDTPVRWIAGSWNGIAGIVAVGTAAASGFVALMVDARHDAILVTATAVITGLLVQRWLVAGCALLAYITGFYLCLIVDAPHYMADLVVNEQSGLLGLTAGLALFVTGPRLVLLIPLALLVMSLKMTGLAGYRKLRQRQQGLRPGNG